METLNEKKERLKVLCDNLPRGGKKRLSLHAGVSTTQIWNLCNHPRIWTTAEREAKIWQFFEKRAEVSRSEDAVEVERIEEHLQQMENGLIVTLQEVRKLRASLGLPTKHTPLTLDRDKET
jgi:hypothetical protein